MRFDTVLPVITGEANVVKLRLAGTGTSTLDGDLKIIPPPGWSVQPEAQHITLRSGSPSEIAFQPKDRRVWVMSRSRLRCTSSASRRKLHPANPIAGRRKKAASVAASRMRNERAECLAAFQDPAEPVYGGAIR